MSIEVKEFIKDPKYTNIKTFYKETLAKVGELETTISNLDNVYLPLSGGTLTGDLTTTQTEFNTQSFVTKKWVQENTVTGSFLPSTGGIIQGKNSNGQLNIYDKYLMLERYDNNERVSYVYLASGSSRDSFVPDFTMNTTKPFTYNGTTINFYQNQINTSGYSWKLGSEEMYILPTGIELVSNGLQSEYSKDYGQINLNINYGLIIQKKDANGNTTHNLQLNSGTNTAQIYLYVNDGKNKAAVFNVDGLTFSGTDCVLDKLYFNSSGIAFETKETDSRKVQYFTTRDNHKISYKNQTETGTIEFKPITTDGEVKLTVSNTVSSTTHTVTMYNGHTSTTQTEFNNNDYVTKQYVDSIKAEYDDLLEKYNDLAERLNTFLLNTGEVEPEPEPLPTLTDELITVPTNHVSISLNANNFYLDWGDGSEVETITSNSYVTKTHDYAETKVWKIKIGPNNENAFGEIEAYYHGDETYPERGTDPNQFTEVNLNHLIYNINDYPSSEDIANSTTLTTYKINYPAVHQGCGFEFLVNCPNLTEVYFGPLTEGIAVGPIYTSDGLENNLTAIYLDLDTEVFETSTDFMFYRQSLTDIYFYNETPISLYYETQTYLTDEEYFASQKGEPIDVSGLTIHVPSAAVEAYKSAPGWSIYADRIVGY